MSDSKVDLAVDGPTAPPRANGELAFTEPWQPRAFALAVGLSEAGIVPWPAFQQALIEAIDRDATERSGSGEDLDDGYDYWACWFEALSRVLDEHGVCPESMIDQRAVHVHEHNQH